MTDVHAQLISERDPLIHLYYYTSNYSLNEMV